MIPGHRTAQYSIDPAGSRRGGGFVLRSFAIPAHMGHMIHGRFASPQSAAKAARLHFEQHASAHHGVRANPHRVTKDELEGLAASLNEMSRHKHDFSIERAYGQPRLMAQGGSVEISPRLSSKELAQWIRAFAQGLSIGKAVR
jgi:hypothetical protein